MQRSKLFTLFILFLICLTASPGLAQQINDINTSTTSSPTPNSADFPDPTLDDNDTATIATIANPSEETPDVNDAEATTSTDTFSTATTSPPSPTPQAQSGTAADQLVFDENNHYIVVMNRTNGTEYNKHWKWLKKLSDSAKELSHLSSNVNKIGDFAWYTGAFDRKALNNINASNVVNYIVPDVTFTPYDKMQISPPSWGLQRIGQRTLPLVNHYIYPDSAGEGVTIYVLDTGVNLDHADFEGRATFGASFAGNPNDKTDPNGHGTFVAGVAAGRIFGVAKKARIVSVRALDADGSGKLSTILKAIDWIVKRQSTSDNNKSIVNLSLGAAFSQPTNDAIQEAIKFGIHFSIAAGNEGKDACQFSPASVKGALVVGATNSDDTVAKYSNIGDCVDIYAPGTNIVSAWKDGTTSTHVRSGTSMASPHVAGVMALLLSQANYSPPELIAKITETATRLNGTSAPKLLLYVYSNDTSVAIVADKPTGAASRLSSCWASNIIIVISVFFLVFRGGVGL
ncbi:2628_t:CDS:2 [Paraglomus brasilianum]|uniref:2628_t:CDS:1 n=1 Tax=Paraglomus brasilianum TaxID=144538 RepID=A0A9N8Z4S1_9GLOM|nr:2628_t:CDS:2 [Paraglomus brasilianum]